MYLSECSSHLIYIYLDVYVERDLDDAYTLSLFISAAPAYPFVFRLLRTKLHNSYKCFGIQKSRQSPAILDA